MRTFGILHGTISGLVFLGGRVVATATLNAQTIVPFQPDVRWGGRAESVTVHPGDPRQAIVAAERGGLFRTQDGGETWHHLDRLTMIRMRDVKCEPASAPGTQVVIATGPYDGRVVSRGGIWRSRDGGHTWQEPGGSNPP